jgi:DNA polymerase-3 subunit alpha
MEILVFPKVMAACDPLLADDAILCVKGRLDLRDETPRVVAVEITQPKLVLEEGAPVRLKIRAESLTDERATRLQELLREHPGDRPVFVHLQGDDKTTVLRLSDDHLVDDSNGLYGELRVLLGRDCIA